MLPEDRALLRSVVEELAALKKAFRDHRHTGIDSKEVEVEVELTNQGSLTAKDTSTVNATYGAEEAGVIENTRTRVEEIENALIAIGVLS